MKYCRQVVFLRNWIWTKLDRDSGISCKVFVVVRPGMVNRSEQWRQVGLLDHYVDRESSIFHAYNIVQSDYV